MTIKELKNEYQETLSKWYPAEEINSFISLLAEHYLNYTRYDLVVNASEELSEDGFYKFKQALNRLAKQEPIQYIIGECHFFGNDFVVNEHTLIPRPETEQLVQWVITDLEEVSDLKTILDLGTGTGCIAISLAKAIENSKVTALDLSAGALAVANENAKKNEVAIDLIQSDLLSDPILPDTYHIIVSNPPYVRNLEKKWMKPNVLDYEPDLALFVSDEDPLLYYRHIARLAQTYLASNGILYLEINQYLTEDLNVLLQQEGFAHVEIRNDLFGNPRMAKAMRT